MRALVVKHDHVSFLGPIGERFEERGFELVDHLIVSEENFKTPAKGEPLPDLDGFDVIVLMGALWSAYDSETIPWVVDEAEKLREADRRGIPVLGICFGGQVLAQAHGGSVEPSGTFEIGWTDIESDDPDLVAPGPWFQWHFDRFTPPPEATEVARNDVAPQAFTLRRNLGTQFHPELAPKMLRAWLGNGGAASASARGIDPDELVSSTLETEDDARKRAHALVDAFLDRVAFPKA